MLSLHDKFLLSVRETFDPVTVLGFAYDAGISQAENNDPSYGQGAKGYASRFGAGLAGEASSQLFKDVLYPTIFPRTRGTTAWDTGVKESASFTAWNIPSWPTGKMGRRCSILRNGWVRRAPLC